MRLWSTTGDRTCLAGALLLVGVAKTCGLELMLVIFDIMQGIIETIIETFMKSAGVFASCKAAPSDQMITAIFILVCYKNRID